MIGKPFYKLNDEVTFVMDIDGEKRLLKGTVGIVDAYGTFEQNEEPSYDVWVEDWMGSGQRCFVKHIRESALHSVEENE